MLLKYLDAAMHHAHYEMLEDDGTFYGEIPGFPGVFSNAASLEESRDQLAEVLEEWIFLRISRNLPIPTVDGLDLKVQEVNC